MPDSEAIELTTSSDNAGGLRLGYILSTFAVCAAAIVAGLLIRSRPAMDLPTIGQMLIAFAAAAAATGLLFSFRVTSAGPRAVRYASWGLLLAAGVVLAFGMSVSENLGGAVVKKLGLLREGGDPVPLVISRTAAVFAVASIGSVAAFLWSSLLELKKYHTFLCVRLMRARITNYLVTLAVAGSVFVLIVVLSVLWGFDRDLRSRIRGTLAAVSIEARGNDRVREYDTLIEWIKEDPELGELVTECAPYVLCFVFLKSAQYTTQALVRGIDMDRERLVGDIESYLRNDKTPDFLLDGEKPRHPGIIVGHELANTIHLRDGEGRLRTGTEITLDPPLSPGFINKPTFTVVGEFKSGYLEYDSRFVYIPITEAQELAGYDYNEATGIGIALRDYSVSDRVKQALIKKLTPEGQDRPMYSVKEWTEQRPTLLAAVHLERVVMTVILGSMIVLAGLFVCAVMLMAVKEKTRDIGIVKALGGTVAGIMEIFLINGFVIGTLGAALGGAGGLLFVKHINGIAKFMERFGLRVFPTDIYYLDKIPAYVDFVGVAMILCAAMAVRLVAAMVPSLLAARLNPVEALRYE